MPNPIWIVFCFLLENSLRSLDYARDDIVPVMLSVVKRSRNISDFAHWVRIKRYLFIYSTHKAGDLSFCPINTAFRSGNEIVSVILSETKWSRNISDFAYWKNNLSLFLIYAIISNRVEVSWFLFTWWRSGNDNNYNNAYCMAPSGGDNNNHNVTTELGVRPALHSLTK